MCFPGLGQLYCGRAGRGLIQFALLSLIGPGLAIVLFATLIPALVLLGAGVLILLIALAFWSASDAKKIALSLQGQDFALRDYNRPAVYVLLPLPCISYAFLFAIVLRATVLEAFVIPTKSMSPTLLPGDRILTNKVGISTRTFSRGDVIVFRNPENRRQVFVQRIVALPGDHVEVTERELFINGQQEHRLAEAPPPNHTPRELKQTIPAGSYFVIGDNRDLSRDSRNFGLLPHGEIIGIVTYLFWPAQSWSRFGQVK
jgi:signal peptidase I